MFLLSHPLSEWKVKSADEQVDRFFGTNGQTELSPAGLYDFSCFYPVAGFDSLQCHIPLPRSYDKLSDGEGLVSIATGAM